MKFFSSKVGGLTKLTLLGCFLLISTTAALAERIKSFDSNIKLSKDGTATIEETFGHEFWHPSEAWYSSLDSRCLQP